MHSSTIGTSNRSILYLLHANRDDNIAYFLVRLRMVSVAYRKLKIAEQRKHRQNLGILIRLQTLIFSYCPVLLCPALCCAVNFHFYRIDTKMSKNFFMYLKRTTKYICVPPPLQIKFWILNHSLNGMIEIWVGEFFVRNLCMCWCRCGCVLPHILPEQIAEKSQRVSFRAL